MSHTGRITREGSRSQQTILLRETIRDEGKFEFWNGDKYEGGFSATRQPLSIVRDGKGTYYSNDGSVYKGTWRRDILEEADEITFSDKSRFTGLLQNGIMEGPGIYKFKEDVEIQGYLIDNKFIGNLELRDPTGHYWKALNPNNENIVIFHPIQTFWSTLLYQTDLDTVCGEDRPYDVAE